MATDQPTPQRPLLPQPVLAIVVVLVLAAIHFTVWAVLEFSIATRDQPETLPGWWRPLRDVLAFPLFTLQDSVAALRNAPEWVEMSFAVANSLLWGVVLRWVVLRIARAATGPRAGGRP